MSNEMAWFGTACRGSMARAGYGPSPEKCGRARTLAFVQQNKHVIPATVLRVRVHKLRTCTRVSMRQARIVRHEHEPCAMSHEP